MVSEQGDNSNGDQSDAGGVDPMSELYLHHSDHPNYAISTRPLDGRNYIHWRRSAEVSLFAKNKIGFVTGSCKRPATNQLLQHHWDRCNNMVIAWLIHSVDKDIAESVLYCRSANQIWKNLESRFGAVNRTRLFQIQKDLIAIEQGNLGIPDYFTKFKRIWDEYVALVEGETCDCGSSLAVTKMIQEQQVIHFMMGLNEAYHVVRGNILMMAPPPSVDDAYRFLVQEEQQRGLNKTTTPSGDGATFSSQSRGGYSGSKKPLFCDHCKVSGHAMDKCWKLHGYPSNSGASGSPSSFCDHCKVGGHTIDKCWKIHGYPNSSINSNGNTSSRPFCTHCKTLGHVVDKCWKLHGFPTEMNTGKSKKVAATTSFSPITQKQYQ